MAPVASLGFSVPGGRAVTEPRTARTNSPRTVSALAWLSPAEPGLKTHWVMPSRSRRSTKISPPWSRRRKAQPISVTVLPTSPAPSAPQLWVRFQLPRGSVLIAPLSSPPHPDPLPLGGEREPSDLLPLLGEREPSGARARSARPRGHPAAPAAAPRSSPRRSCARNSPALAPAGD